MAVTTVKYQSLQKVAEEEYLLLHPETDAEIVKVAAAGITATNVQDALVEIAEKIGAIPTGADVYQLTKTGLDTADSTILATVSSPKNGDIAVISTVVSGVTYSVSSYYYDDEWVAIDGNVDADKCILRKDFVLAGNYTSVGNINKGSNSATKTYNSKGKSVQAFLEEVVSKEEQPSITANVGGSITLTGSGAKEVGTEFTPAYTTTFNKGSYTYGPDTGITPSKYEVSDTDGNTADTATGGFDKFTVGDDTSYKLTVKITYPQGAIAKTNLGNNSNPVVRIAAGSITKESGTVTGYRSMFTYVGTNISAITGAWIRANASNKGNSVTPGTLTIAEGTKRVLIAVPKAKGKTLTSVIDVDGMGLDVKDNFTHTIVSVEGLNGYAAAEYDVWYVDNANGLAATKYTVTLG